MLAQLMNILGGGRPPEPNPYGGSDQNVQHQSLQPEDNGLNPGQVVMSNRGGQPVYYGTDQAKQLAMQGLKNVAAAHGTHSPQWRAAVNAALGVLGPDFQVPANTFNPIAMSRLHNQQQMAGIDQGMRGFIHPQIPHGRPDLGDPGIRAAVVAALSGLRG